MRALSLYLKYNVIYFDVLWNELTISNQAPCPMLTWNTSVLKRWSDFLVGLRFSEIFLRTTLWLPPPPLLSYLWLCWISGTTIETILRMTPCHLEPCHIFVVCKKWKMHSLHSLNEWPWLGQNLKNFTKSETGFNWREYIDASMSSVLSQRHVLSVVRHTLHGAF